MTEEVKQLIVQAKNICLIPSQTEPESVAAALALFYTLKDLGKNVNVVADAIPEKLQSLVPSLDFISQPKNFVIAIPRSLADISQVHYEKNEEHLKIHLTVDKGQLKKEHIDLYATQAKPDLVITLGIADIKSELAGRLDAFGFLLDAPIINLNNSVTEAKSLTEITLDMVRSLSQNHITKPVADCLTAGLAEYFAKQKT